MADDAQPAAEPGRLQGRPADTEVQGAGPEGMTVTSTSSRRRRPLVLLVTALTLLVAGVAAAYWSATGGGSATAATASTSALTLAPATPTAQLYPGGQATVVLTVTNPNTAQVRVGSLALDTSQGTGGFAVDGGHSGAAWRRSRSRPRPTAVPGGPCRQRRPPGDPHQRAVHGDRRGQRLPGRDVHGLPEGGVVKRHLATLAVAVALTIVAATAWAYLERRLGARWQRRRGGVQRQPGRHPHRERDRLERHGQLGRHHAGQRPGRERLPRQAVRRRHRGRADHPHGVHRHDRRHSPASRAASRTARGSTPSPRSFATNWQGPESAKSATVTVNTDTTAPTNSISLSSVTGGAYLSGTTIYYRGTAAGSLRLTNAVADAGSGPASSSHRGARRDHGRLDAHPSTVSTPAGGPYVSNPFSWAAGTTSAPDRGGDRSRRRRQHRRDQPDLHQRLDRAHGRHHHATPTVRLGRSVSITLHHRDRRRLRHRDPAAAARHRLADRHHLRDVRRLHRHRRGNPTSPYVDGSLPVACYKYRYVVTDRVGNQDIATSANVVKVGYAGAVDATAGLLSHWRLGEAASPDLVRLVHRHRGSLAGRAHPARSATTWTHQAGARQRGHHDATGSRSNRTSAATPSTTSPRRPRAPTTRSRPTSSSGRTSPATRSASSGASTPPPHVLHGALGAGRQQLEHLASATVPTARRLLAAVTGQAPDGRTRPTASSWR